MKDSKALATTPAAAIQAQAATLPATTGQAARPIFNVHLNGCNNILNFGGFQQIGQNTCGAFPGADSQALAATIRAQADTIAAQQRTIDRLISMLEKAAAAQLDTSTKPRSRKMKPAGGAAS